MTEMPHHRGVGLEGSYRIHFMHRRSNRRQFLVQAGAAAGVLAAGWSTAARAHAQDDAWGDLVGRLVYDGPSPDRKKLKVDKDLDCCGKFDIRDESLMVGSDGGLANVFLYARTRNIQVCPELEKNVPKRVVLDNRDCIFMPHCMTIWLSRQEFYITNSDPVAQNVAFSPLGDSPANIVLAVGKDATYTFSRAQILPVAIACNYHPWESCFILPRDNPYSAVSGKGRHLPHCPASCGQHRVPGVAGALRISEHGRLAQGTLRPGYQAGHQRPGNHQAQPVVFRTQIGWSKAWF